MTDLNKSTETEATTENTTTHTTQATQATPDTETTQGRCGWSREQWMQRGKCHGKRRWKMFGVAALIFFLGVMAGKAGNHHHYRHAHMSAQATVMIPGERPKPLSAILDSMQATPEQRAKVADLVY